MREMPRRRFRARSKVDGTGAGLAGEATVDTRACLSVATSLPDLWQRGSVSRELR
jgi:hypothetical protein